MWKQDNITVINSFENSYMVFWVMALCQFGGGHLLYTSKLKKVASIFFETLEDTNETTQYRNPDNNFACSLSGL
jgi:hypothetical protein